MGGERRSRSQAEGDESDILIGGKEGEEIDGGWGWLVVCACFFTTFVLDGIGYSFGMFMKPLKLEISGSNFGVASIGSIQVRETII